MNQVASPSELVLCEAGHAVPASRGVENVSKNWPSSGRSEAAAACPVCGTKLTGQAAPVPGWWRRFGHFGLLPAAGFLAYYALTADDLFGQVLMGAGAGYLCLLCWEASWRDGKRRKRIGEAGGQLGLYHAPVASERLWSRLAGLNLFRRGRWQSVEQILQGRIGDTELLLGHLRYTIGSGRNRRTHLLPFVAFFHVAKDWPTFEMAPEGMWDRLLDHFYEEDIDFSGSRADEIFSSRYQLRGQREQSIRTLFGPEVRAWLAERPGWTIEADDGHLVMCREWRSRSFRRRHSHPSSVDEVKRFLGDAAELLERFARYQPPPRHPALTGTWPPT